jgi:hypothetical protein
MLAAPLPSAITKTQRVTVTNSIILDGTDRSDTMPPGLSGDRDGGRCRYRIGSTQRGGRKDTSHFTSREGQR